MRLSVTCWFVLLAVCAGFPGEYSAARAQTGNSCIDCHMSLKVDSLREPAIGIEKDVHNRRGLQCQDCHGGDPKHGFTENNPGLAHNPQYDWRGVPSVAEIPEFCARCHSDVEYMKKYNPKLRIDQLLEYRSSQHGKLLVRGDKKVAQCVSCHGVHGILPVADSRSPVYRTNIPHTCGKCHANPDYMKGYGIPTNQLAEYSESVHGKHLLEMGDNAAPACNDCHGNHGATPPGLTSIANACGECHAINRDYFNQSPHRAAFDAMGTGECNTCHGYHDIQPTSDEMLGIGENSMCINCHDEDAGYEAAKTMRAEIDSLKAIIATSSDLLDRAEQGGADVKRGKFDLQQANSALVKARGAVHYFNPEKLSEVIEPGIEEGRIVEEFGQKALKDLRMRQFGLAFSIPLILLIALGIYVKIRRMESRHHSP